jgi:hypothetical protein
MSRKKMKEHMSKGIASSDNLPSLQQAIIMYLAKSDPQTINQIANEIDKDYSNTHTAFKSLIRKKLVTKTGTKRYREQEFTCYWLTDEGILIALMEGTSADKLLEKTRTLYPDAKVTHCFLQIMPLFDPAVIRMAHSNVKGKGKLGSIELVQLILSGAALPMEMETGQAIVKVLKDYPEQYELLKISVKFMIDQLSQLISD